MAKYGHNFINTINPTTDITSQQTLLEIMNRLYFRCLQAKQIF